MVPSGDGDGQHGAPARGSPKTWAILGRNVACIPQYAKLVAVVGLAVMTAAACSSRAHEEAQQTTLPGLTPKRLAALRLGAIEAAARMGETHPTDGIVVATTEHAVFRAEPAGPKVSGPDFKVYVVAFSGKLTASRTFPGRPHPTGRFAYVIHRADSLAVTDFGLLRQPFDLTSLGPHVPLKLQDAERQLAIAYTERFMHAGNARPGVYRVVRATPVKAGLWRVEVKAGRGPDLGGRAGYSCFAVRPDRFYVHTGPTDNVTSRGIEGANGRCPRST